MKSSSAFILFTITALGIGLSPLDALAQSVLPQRTYIMTPTGVNLVDGTFNYDVEDIAIGPLHLKRNYTSSYPFASDYLGKGWAHNYDMFAEEKMVSGQYMTTIIIGRTVHQYYGLSSSNTPFNSDWGTRLSKVGGLIQFTDRDGTIYSFSPNGTNKPYIVSSINYPSGLIISITNSSNKPKIIASNTGYALVLDYSGNILTAVCGFNTAVTSVNTSTTCSGASLKVQYAYNSSSFLASATDVRGVTWSYGYQSAYAGGGLLNCVYNPATATCKIANVYQIRSDLQKAILQSQTLGDGSTWQFDCTCGANALMDPDEANPPPETTTVTFPGGATATTSFNIGTAQVPAPPYAVNYTDQLGRQFPLAIGDLPDSITFPEGNKMTWAYTTQGRIERERKLFPKPGSGQSVIVVESRTFPTTGCTSATFTSLSCNLPLTSTDANNNTTDYTYDAVHGGVLTESGPPVNGIRRVIRYAYVQRYAWVSNGAGGYVQASSPVWLKSEERTCRTTATVSNACAGGAADEIVTTYDYGPASGPNNLLLRGMTVAADVGGTITTLRTCYGYDVQGNRVSKTKPRAGLTVCS